MATPPKKCVENIERKGRRVKRWPEMKQQNGKASFPSYHGLRTREADTLSSVPRQVHGEQDAF